MSKRRTIRRTQKISIFIMSSCALLLIIFMLKAPSLDIFLFNQQLAMPKMPEMDEAKIAAIDSVQLPEYIVLTLSSDDPFLLKSLQQQGWPAYLANGSIHIGPYLKSFLSQFNPSKISQITPITVRITHDHFI